MKQVEHDSAEVLESFMITMCNRKAEIHQVSVRYIKGLDTMSIQLSADDAFLMDI